MTTNSSLASFEKQRWKAAQDAQMEVCLRLGVEYFPVNPFDNIGVASFLDKYPFHGLRHPPQNYSGWFLWAGEMEERDDFFNPVHAIHLLDALPKAVKYLGLAPGYRFLIDNSGYEDIWFDESLLLINDGG